mgnify:FL=1
MPTNKLSDELAQEALDWAEEYGSAHNAKKVLGKKAPSVSTIDGRITIARLRGFTPTTRKPTPKVYTRERLGRIHLIIPDAQIRPGVPLDFLTHIGNYIAEKRPDVIVNIGDFADLSSLSTYDKGTLKGEGRRLKKDLDAAKLAMELLTAPFRDIKDYKPEMHLTMGNHENRLARFINEHPLLEGLLDDRMLRYQDYGWKVHPFLKIVEIDGISYSHYFTTGGSDRAVSSAAALLRKNGKSAVMGHNQKTDVAFHPFTHQWGLFVGVCNDHDEDYLGFQGNKVRKQIVVLHEVAAGCCDPMWVSLSFLRKAYS